MIADREGLNLCTETIIGAAYRVFNTLGHGFLEKVYENALALELSNGGLAVGQQQHLVVKYRAEEVGHYVADLVVEDRILLEVKATKGFDKSHFAQCLHYLKATGLPVCLLLNFGTPDVQIKRIVNRF